MEIMEKTNLMKGWDLEVTDGTFEIVNRSADGQRQYFRIIPGPYSPVIEEEPEKAFPVPVASYVGKSGEPTTPDMRVKGIIVKESPGGKVIYRGNLTNFFGKDAGKLVDGGNAIEVGEARYFLYRLMYENKARMTGYIAFYKPEPSAKVEVIDASDLC
jgi:hypothetical protein